MTVEEQVKEWASFLYEQLKSMPEYQRKMFLEWYLSRLVSASVTSVVFGAPLPPPPQEDMET